MASVEQRFWSKVEKTEGCWLWTASTFRTGYGQFRLGKTNTSAHRVAFELVNGPIPPGTQIDHRCGCRACVNPDHMRLATNAENTRNKCLTATNTSGYKGVSWSKKGGKWQAQIKLMGKQKHLGLFLTKEAAHDAYRRAAILLHGEFANFG